MAPSLREAGAAAAAAAVQAVAGEIKTPFTCLPRLLESPSRAAGLPDGCCYVVLALGLDGRRALIELETGFAAALVDRLSGGTCPAFAPQEPSAAEVAALSYLALHGLRAVRSLAAIEKALAPRFLFLARDGHEAAALLGRERTWVSVELDLAIGDVAGFGRLLLPAPTATRLARAFAKGQARCDLHPAITAAALDARLVAGIADLTAEDFAQLAEGDAVVLSGLKRLESGLAGDSRLEFRGFHFNGRFEDGRFTLMSVTDVIAPEALMHDTATQLSSLPIEVQVELAKLKVPLSKLDSLQPGSVIDLGVALTDSVVLRIGDRAVAQAELVDIDGELGARILALFP
ncbi:MAG: FliM/FliN family flagellar motor switch protein [Myxococcales bacterium]